MIEVCWSSCQGYLLASICCLSLSASTAALICRMVILSRSVDEACFAFACSLERRKDTKPCKLESLVCFRLLHLGATIQWCSVVRLVSESFLVLSVRTICQHTC